MNRCTIRTLMWLAVVQALSPSCDCGAAEPSNPEVREFHAQIERLSASLNSSDREEAAAKIAVSYDSSDYLNNHTIEVLLKLLNDSSSSVAMTALVAVRERINGVIRQVEENPFTKEQLGKTLERLTFPELGKPGLSDIQSHAVEIFFKLGPSIFVYRKYLQKESALLEAILDLSNAKPSLASGFSPLVHCADNQGVAAALLIRGGTLSDAQPVSYEIDQTMRRLYRIADSPFPEAGDLRFILVVYSGIHSTDTMKWTYRKDEFMQLLDKIYRANVRLGLLPKAVPTGLVEKELDALRWRVAEEH